MDWKSITALGVTGIVSLLVIKMDSNQLKEVVIESISTLDKLVCCKVAD